MQRFKSFALILLMGIAAASLAVPSAKATVVLDVVGGQLLGATGVVVDSFGGFGGGTYDVEFLDGSCAELFLPCNPLQMPPGIRTAPFIGDGDVAFSAGNALLGQVFTGIYDSNPGLTQGCAGSASTCTIFVPSGLGSGSVSATKVFNGDGTEGNLDFCCVGTTLSTGTTTGDTSVFSQGSVWALFTLASASSESVVPEPGTLAIFGFGLAGLGAMRRRGRRAAK